MLKELFKHTLFFTPLVFWLNGFSVSNELVLGVIQSFVLSIFIAGVSTFALSKRREAKAEKLYRELAKKAQSENRVDLSVDWEKGGLPRKEDAFLYSEFDALNLNKQWVNDKW